EQPYDVQSQEMALQEVEVFECYILHDENDDGIAELRQVFYAGNEILSNEECDYIPFYSICPIPIPHKFFGNSLADRTTDLQLIKTTVTRQMLDNLYLTNDARTWAVDGQVNLDDLLTSTAGGVIRVKSPQAIGQLAVQNVSGQSFPMLQYLDQVQQKRTGVTELSQGLDANILQNVTAAAVASMQQAGAGKIELIARLFAEGGVKELFEGILHLVTKYQNKERILRLRGQYVSVDPRTWSNQYDLSINVGLGNGNRDQQLAMLQMVIAKQEQMLSQFGPANPLVSLGQYRNTLGRFIEAAGFKDSAEFFKQITPEMDQQLQNPPPQQPQMSPEAQAVMAQTQANIQAQQAKTQADIQAQQAKMQAELQLEREKAALELQLMREKETAKLQLEIEKLQAQNALRQREFETEAQLKAMKVGAGITSNVEIPG
ncbi:MAG: portal protein, partial [Ilumatobacteraceae bacterium]